MKRKTSLKDIAEKIGVSITLVSYVLNNKEKKNRVSEKTAKEIRRVAKDLDYHPNLNARSLKTNKSRSIGLVVADISNPFFSNLARTIEDEAYSHDYTLIFGSSDENVEKFNRVLEFLKTRQVDGFIMACPEGSKASVVGLLKLDVPMVLVDRYFPDIKANYVVVDNYQASVDATKYLLNKGHKKIGAIMYQSKLEHYENRASGYVDTLEHAGILPGDKYLRKINHKDLHAEMKLAIRNLIIEHQIDAIYFSTNTIATEGLKQIMSLGKKIPSDIEVIVFDQNAAHHFFKRFIPFINQPIKELGKTAVRLLIDQIEGGEQEIKKIHLGATLETKMKDEN